MNGAIARFKARWVIQGYLSQFEIDFNQIFVVIVKLIAFKILFTIAAYYDLNIDSIDI